MTFFTELHSHKKKNHYFKKREIALWLGSAVVIISSFCF